MIRIKVIYPNGEAHVYKVHEVVIEDHSAKIYVRDGQIIVAQDDSGEKW